jgi:hypothetical protein
MSMTTPPTYYLRELGPEAQAMARNCKNERLAMTLQYRRHRQHDHHGRRSGNPGVERRLRLARPRPRQVKMIRRAKGRGTKSREPSNDGS